MSESGPENTRAGSARASRRLLLSVDATAYGVRHGRAQATMQEDLLRVLSLAADLADLHREEWSRQGSGDGELAVLPGSVSEQQFVDDFVRRLAQALRDHNEDRQSDRRLRLRLALHHGMVTPSANGFSGAGVVTVSRLQNSAPLRRALVQSDADLAVALSRPLYEDMVCQHLTTWAPETFREVQVRNKETEQTAWLWVSRGDIHGLDLEGPSVPPDLEPSGDRAAGPVGTGQRGRWPGDEGGDASAAASRVDFSVMYVPADLDWADWIAVTLEEAGYHTWLQEYDVTADAVSAARLRRAVQRAERSVAVLTPAFLGRHLDPDLARTGLAEAAEEERGRLIPVRVAPCQVTDAFANASPVDLVGLDAKAAKQRLLAAVQPSSRSRTGPQGASAHPASDGDGPHFPGEARPPQAPPAEDPSPPESPRVFGGGDSGSGEQAPWDWLSRQRPSIDELLRQPESLVGHAAPQDELRARLDDAENAALVLVSGPAGSGKTALITWLASVAGDRLVLARDVLDALDDPLQDDGSNVDGLLVRLRPAVTAAGKRAVLVYDDADHELRIEGITRFVREAIARLDVGFLVVCTSTPLTLEPLAILPTALPLDRRRATLKDFEQFLDRVLRDVGEERAAFHEDLRRSLHDLSEQTADFRAVQYLIEMLLAHYQWTGTVTHAAVLLRLLEADPVRQLHLPAVRVGEGGRLSFRRRDKSELLAQLLAQHFETPEALAAAAGRLEGLDGKAFLGRARAGFWNAVMELCLTHSPRDLVLRLLDEEQVRQGIRALRLDPAKLVDKREEQAHLLVRGLGFTLTDTPQGLRALEQAVSEAQVHVEDERARTDVVKAAGQQVVRRVNAAMLDLLHFWATELFGSESDLVKTVNAQRRSSGQEPVRRLDPRAVVTLLRHVNDSAADDESIYRLSYSEGGLPVRPELVTAYDTCVQAQEAFERNLSAAGHAAPAAKGLRIRCRRLVDTASEVLRQARIGPYPSPIKLTEIIFDEYGRKIFRGVDSDDRDVRFALTDDEDRDELVVAAHYFMLPQLPVSVNPHIVPASASPRVLFDRPRDYELASTTQRRQGNRLLQLLELRPDDRVLEVGSGTGGLAIEVARRVRSVLGIDHSAEMVRRSEVKAADAGQGNVSFQVADLLQWDAGDRFDVVLSSATMHWVLPEDDGYQQLFRLLRHGGRLGVHQGGEGNYRGLHRHAVQVLKDLGLSDHFRGGWRYPIYYPSVEEYRRLLRYVGFVDIEVIPLISDGSEYPDLVRDFSEAGLLPYLKRLPERSREFFRTEFVQQAADAHLDLYTHRLYALAVRP